LTGDRAESTTPPTGRLGPHQRFKTPKCAEDTPKDNRQKRPVIILIGTVGGDQDLDRLRVAAVAKPPWTGASTPPQPFDELAVNSDDTPDRPTVRALEGGDRCERSAHTHRGLIR